MGCQFQVRFFGAFTLLGPEDVDLTPKSAKARGLLALVFETDDMRRSRRWLESKLWSDRGPEQSSGSLRQALREIKTSLGPWADVLGADRGDVWFDQSKFEVDLKTDARCPEGRELLEGLEIRDDAFISWISALKQRHGQTVPAASDATRAGTTSRGVTIRAVSTQSGSTAERIVGQIIGDQTAKALEERLSGRRFADTAQSCSAKSSDADLEIKCDVAQDGAHSMISVRIEGGADGAVLFSGHQRVEGSTSDLVTPEVISDIVQSASAKIVHSLPMHMDLSRPEAAALGFSSLGLRKLAQFDATGLDEAQGYFSQAYDSNEKGIYLAWRAFVRMAQLVEGVEGDSDVWREEVKEFVALALESSSDNGLVVALSALTRIMIDDDLDGPAQLAQHAINWNSGNLFAQQTLAVAHSATGDTRRAYELSTSCRRAAQADEFRHLWDLYHSLVCISAGKLGEAREASERALKFTPSFVAPRRQLITLCANAGDLSSARSHVEALKKLEPKFSLDRYFNDPRYPVLTLRNADLLRKACDAFSQDENV